MSAGITLHDRFSADDVTRGCPISIKRAYAVGGPVDVIV